MSIELILLAVNINLVAFSSFLGDIVGQVFALLVLTVAAAEAAVGLAVLVVYFRNRGSIAVDDVQSDEGLTRHMIQAIVFLPLIGAILAGLIAIFGAHARNPSGDTVEHHGDGHGRWRGAGQGGCRRYPCLQPRARRAA